MADVVEEYSETMDKLAEVRLRANSLSLKQSALKNSISRVYESEAELISKYPGIHEKLQSISEDALKVSEELKFYENLLSLKEVKQLIDSMLAKR